MRVPDKGSPPGETAGLKDAQVENDVQVNHHRDDQINNGPISEVVRSHNRGRC